jgi:hypothetical protein
MFQQFNNSKFELTVTLLIKFGIHFIKSDIFSAIYNTTFVKSKAPITSKLIMNRRLKSLQKVPCSNFSNNSLNQENRIMSTIRPRIDKTRTDISKIVKDNLVHIKGTLLEVMARRMPSETRAYLAEKWGYHHSTSEQSQPTLSAVAPMTSTPITSDHKHSVALPVKDSTSYHPVLGKILCDLSYKKVYLTSVNKLVNAPIWEKQRILRPHRAIKIAKSKSSVSANIMNTGLPGVITLYRY